MASNLRRERHSVSAIRVHLVCVVKYRKKIITLDGLEVIKASFEEVAKKMDFKLEEFEGEEDHIHALIEYPPKLSISQIVNTLKGVSSRKYGAAGHSKPFGKDALWSPSYFASSVGGAPIEVLKAYIQNQDKPKE
jgi:putative transposase